MNKYSYGVRNDIIIVKECNAYTEITYPRISTKGDPNSEVSGKHYATKKD